MDFSFLPLILSRTFFLSACVLLSPIVSIRRGIREHVFVFSMVLPNSLFASSRKRVNCCCCLFGQATPFYSF
ncbi:MAG: hypothetical protein J3R72DRAFT_188653 [Linnemannia gamsii]|nr:MAG: hypothetical protein J3R72DRAFT_188653 [Linnemannia gamsii]